MKNIGIWKIIFIMTGLLFLSLLLITMLNFYKIEKNCLEIHKSIVKVEAEKLKNSIEAGLDLGIQLNEMKNIKSYILNAIKTEESIKNIEIFDEQGNLCFCSGKKEIKSNKNIEKIEKIKFSKNKNGGNFIIPFKNNLELYSGVGIISYSTSNIRKILNKTFVYQMKIVSLVFLVSFIFLSFSIFLIFRKSIEKIDEFENLMGEELEENIEGGIEVSYNNFRKKYFEDLKELENMGEENKNDK
jgi:hypothetical protein